MKDAELRYLLKFAFGRKKEFLRYARENLDERSLQVSKELMKSVKRYSKEELEERKKRILKQINRKRKEDMAKFDLSPPKKARETIRYLIGSPPRAPISGQKQKSVANLPLFVL